MQPCLGPGMLGRTWQGPKPCWGSLSPSRADLEHASRSRKGQKVGWSPVKPKLCPLLIPCLCPFRSEEPRQPEDICHSTAIRSSLSSLNLFQMSHAEGGGTAKVLACFQPQGCTVVVRRGRRWSSCPAALPRSLHWCGSNQSQDLAEPV